MNTNTFTNKICAVLFVLLVVFTITSTSWATTYYVSTIGNDSNPGNSLTQPLQTIQKCLNTVQPGDKCFIRGGTYNASLTLQTSGTETAPITIKNYNSETVTINSGGSKTLVSSKGTNWYVIDGLRFISSMTTVEGTYTINFMTGWPWDVVSTTGGNNHITLQNCYIEGNVQFYGSNNLVNNCEFNGKDRNFDAIAVCLPASKDNTISNNKIHGFTNRGVWAWRGMSNVLITGNEVYGPGIAFGINCDGASVAVHECNVTNNYIHDISSVRYTTGIALEDTFDSSISGNYISGVTITGGSWGKLIYVQGYGVGYKDTGGCGGGVTECRDKDYNTTINDNVLFQNNGGNDGGIAIVGVNGLRILNNTFVSNSGWYSNIRAAADSTFVPHKLEIRNNIFANATSGIMLDNSGSLAESTFSNNLFSSAVSVESVGGTGYTLTQCQAAGREQNSKVGNPLFVSATNFHLQASSPAVDAAYPVSLTTDFDSRVRPQGSGFDIGAYEFVSSQTPVPSAPKGFRLVN